MTEREAGQAIRLAGAGGFVVESADGELGWVEEVWLDEQNAPRALAVCTGDGKRGLIVAADVVAVDEEHEWVVVRPQTTLLELAPPLLASADGERLAASWATTGKTIEPAPVHGPRSPGDAPVDVAGPITGADAEPVTRTIVVLFVGIVLLAALMMTVAFVVAKIVTGAAY